MQRAITPDDIEAYSPEEQSARIAADLEAVFDVPVQVSAVLGRSRMDVGELLRLGPGTVLELDRARRRGDRHLRQQPPGGARRSRAGRGQARRHHDGNHQLELNADKSNASAASARASITGARHAASHRRYAEGSAHRSDQDRDGQRRDGHPRRRQRTGACACCAAARAPTCCWSMSASTSATW